MLALAIPAAIHFLLRRQPRIEYWGATRFLKLAVNRKQVQLQVRSVSQLFVRIAIIAFLVLSAAEPHLDAHLDSKNVDRPVHRLLILDVSMSMSATRDGQSPFDEMQKQVLATLSNRFPGDSWQLLLHGNNDQPERIRIPVYDPEVLQEEVSQLTTTSQSANLGETLQRSLTFTEEFPGNSNEVLFWTDLAESEWKQSGSKAFELGDRLNQLSRLAHLSVIDLSAQSEEMSNLAIKDVRVQNGPVKVGEPCTLEVVIENPSGTASKTFVQFISNSEVTAEKDVQFQSQTELTVQFETVFTNSELKRCEIRIGDDALAADNLYYFTIPVLSEARVLVVEDFNSSPMDLQQSDFLQLALSPPIAPRSNEAETPPTFLSVGPTRFRELALSNFDVIILAGISNLTAADSDRLKQFVESGGGLMISMSEGMSSVQYNDRLGPNGAGLLPGVLGKRVSIHLADAAPFQVEQVSNSHPMVAPFKLHPESGLSTTRIYSYVQLTPVKDETFQRVVDLDSGDPLVAEHRVGQGRVMLVTSAFDTEWGSWVLWPSFLPMLREAVEHLSFNQDGTVQSIIGKAVPENVLSLPKIASIQNEQGQVIWDQHIETEQLQDVFDTYLSRPGQYSLKSNFTYSPVQVLSRNCDVAESSLKGDSAENLLRSSFLKGLNVEIVENAEVSTTGRRTFEGRAESHLSRWLVFAAILLLIVDQLFAVRTHLAPGAIMGLALSVFLVLLLRPTTSTSVVLILLGALSGAFFSHLSTRSTERTTRTAPKRM